MTLPSGDSAAQLGGILMSKPERSRIAAFDQTWPVGVDLGRAPTLISSVSTVRVKLIGATQDVAATLPSSADGKTRPYPSALPSLEDCIAVDNTAHNDADEWHDVSGLVVTASSHQALAYARTLPAIPIEELGLEDSGVHEIQRLRLWLHPRDSVPCPEPRDGTPTLRVNAAPRGLLARAWEAWEQQSPGMAIFTATVLCVVSVLAVSLFAH
jgi:hypothetical protein